MQCGRERERGTNSQIAKRPKKREKRKRRCNSNGTTALGYTEGRKKKRITTQSQKAIEHIARIGRGGVEENEKKKR